MNYKRIHVGQADDDLLKTLAIWHNQTPSVWLSDYTYTDEDVMKTLDRMKNKPNYIGVACDDGVRGFIWAEVHDTSIMILSLYIEEAYRQKNIASQLKNFLEAWCIENKIYKIQTTVSSKNPKMLALNEKLGYEAKMVHMEKHLKEV